MFRASTVLQKNNKLYGAQNALMDNDSNCWNSDQGEKQCFIVKFGRSVSAKKISIEFQAGFSSEFIRVFCKKADGSMWEESDEFEPEDSLELQTFQLPAMVECTELRIDFEDCRDFYGRITVYRIQVWGSKAQASEPREENDVNQ
mmetsp:Transcript_17109/g.25924  ORF Transcript_17109/g.25924 Transcript_17109/m.25924 type:complete len:145 (+) Transcript_17109:235-669(+)